ncbi:LOW QUALITY PROTEIN: uncharacterized protein [Amphiura filiformis]|uniref:LOW QUALITY PROTEIN: uncharacterized protein n=1 Tax=Amphiura filiformis TaxID=82378 RepID=UPI003B21D085
MPCINGGTCLDRIDGYECQCLSGWSGPSCEINIDECGSMPCLNGGTCLDRIDGYECQCLPGWSGPSCEINIDECGSMPCLNGGTCLDRINGYECQCLPGWSGPACDTNIDECGSMPCLNGGTCLDRIDGYECQCLPGWSGPACDINIDECGSMPCLNGGTCLDRVDGYECQCLPGWSGPSCEINIDECGSMPCLNGGTCLDRIDGYECQCLPGWSGPSCKINFNECASMPCRNGGNCEDGVNGYDCRCHSGWSGPFCEIGWYPWETWSSCSEPCGGGSRTRYRTCSVYGACRGPVSETGFCRTEPCHKNNLYNATLEWEAWSSCSSTCGGGSRSRIRTCDRSKGCRGSLYESDSCNTQTCPARWHPWGTWSSCSEPCGGGSRSRYRTCSVYGACRGPVSETGFCSTQPCQWGAWSSCSHTCGSASRSRIRTCGRSEGCRGLLHEIQNCETQTCSNAVQIRLVGGSNNNEGRVEVFYSNAWGTVCDDFWDVNDARVVCRQLGLPHGAAEAIGNAAFGQGSGEIWLDNVQCTGSENRLDECNHRGWGIENCDHREDAGVRCVNSVNAVQIRLVGGSNINEGRVEVFYDNAWGTVCHDLWGVNDARVVCRQLGLPYGAAQGVGRATFGQGSGVIWLDNVECTGSENRLDECNHNGWGIGNCDHSEDAGVRCVDSANAVQIRLVGGSNNNEGRVEVFYSNAWGTVCDDFWDVNDARVVCRQLGLPHGAAEAIGNAAFGQGSGEIWLDNVQCTGSENRLDECNHRGWGIENCDHREDAGVRCVNSVNAVQIRLVGGSNINEGRVEVFYDNAWGTVCHDLWGVNDARVVCRQLGLPYGAAQGVGRATFGQGSGVIWLDNVECTGSENRLDECNHNGWGIGNCDHSEDAGVRCVD